ncbi:hypothetical protein SAY87_002787 [Trapa incisa]|uniref:Protein CHROMOSOME TRANSMISSION FIDELITY 7 n=1 Tax=Trapa incisa TaxID=236973 RepID=A0AAN7PW39_9MYRT|nr:hypothetical protein SAY87_002787 [Trapa incisa]
MQPKISSFFNQPVPPGVSEKSGDPLELWEKTENVIVRTYERRPPKSNGETYNNKESNTRVLHNRSISKGLGTPSIPGPTISGSTVNKNKKRSYAQFHLVVGQSDFLLRTCSACGMKYAPGDEEDEKAHTVFHKNYTLGVPFKGWINERLIRTPSTEVGRIVVVLQSDPLAHRKKVQEVVKMMESELGCGWICNELCKVYLFITSQRIAGCLVAEPIKEAFKFISDYETKTEAEGPNIKEGRMKLKSVGLRFGNIEFQREVMKKLPSVAAKENLSGAIYCEEDAVPAVCGVRAIWVSPSHRRKHIATHLLDAMRRSFCMGTMLDHSELAFSQPTSAGKALLFHYMGSRPCLLYKADASNLG